MAPLLESGGAQEGGNMDAFGVGNNTPDQIR